MRLGIDFDGTVADITDAKIRFALEHFGEEINALETYRPHGVPRLGEERFDAMVRGAHTEWTPSMPPMPGALEALRDLAARHELFVVTARNDDEIDWARSWLEPHALPFREVVHTRRASKADACEALGIHLMFDDSPFVLTQLEETALHLALIEADYNREGAVPDRTHRVSGWGHFLEVVEALEGGGSG